MPAIDLVLRTAQDDSDRTVLGDVARVGWHIVGITEDVDPPLPPYAFSVGMYYTLGSPELVVAGLPAEVAAELINALGDAVRGGRALACDMPITGFLTGYDVVLKPVSPTRYKSDLGYAVWFYRNLPQGFPCWQVFWPDQAGHFPWDAACPPAMRTRQIDFTTSDS